METPIAARLLLVEDNLDDVAITKRALSERFVDADLFVARDGQEALSERFIEADVFVARDGQEALDFLHREGAYTDAVTAPRPDMILLDLNLPKVSGMEVLRHLREDEDLSSIPVIVLTSSKRDEDVVRSYQLGANTYVQKPVEFQKFIDALRIFRQYWIVVATLPSRTERANRRAA